MKPQNNFLCLCIQQPLGILQTGESQTISRQSDKCFIQALTLSGSPQPQPDLAWNAPCLLSAAHSVFFSLLFPL